MAPTLTSKWNSTSRKGKVMAPPHKSEEDLKKLLPTTRGIVAIANLADVTVLFSRNTGQWPVQTGSLLLPLEPLPLEPLLLWAASLLEASLTDPRSTSLEPRLPLVTDSRADHQPLTEALMLAQLPLPGSTNSPQAPHGQRHPRPQGRSASSPAGSSAHAWCHPVNSRGKSRRISSVLKRLKREGRPWRKRLHQGGISG